MKKLTLIVVLLALCAVSKAQQSALIKYAYLPEHTYNVKMKMLMDMEMSMNGDSATNARLKAQGVKQPMQINMNMEMMAHGVTGALKADKTFSYTMRYDSLNSTMTMNGKITPMPANPIIGKSLTGECDADGKLHVDKITTPGADEQVKAAMTDMLNKMQALIKFPEKPMAIGDTFTQEVPMSIPAAGMNMDFVIKTVYKLTGIKGKQAFFDTDMSMNFDLNTEKNGIAIKGNGSGGGSGKMVYALAKKYPASMNNDFDMTFNMDIKEMKMVMKMKMKSDVQTGVTAN
jgi:hypothetical protein